MTRSGTRKQSILLVEDDEALRALFTEVLDTAGFFVTAIRLAEDVPEVLRRNAPDLIVLDLVMPSGHAGRRIARAASRGGRVETRAGGDPFVPRTVSASLGEPTASPPH